MMNIIILLLAIITISYSKSYKAVDDLDLDKYVGRWYEVYGDRFDMTFQGNGKCVEAFYKFIYYF